MTIASQAASGTELTIDADADARQRAVLWRLRFEKACRVAHRCAAFPDLSIFGCYDAGNVGDLALGRTVEGIASRLARTAFDSPRHVGRLLPPRAAVLAGGGVITARPASPLSAFSSYVQRRECAVAAIGVSATLEKSELPEAALRTLSEAVWISTRSAKSADDLARILGRSDIVVQPDIAFALRLSRPGLELPPRRPKRLLINASPFLHSRQGDRLVAHSVPSPWFSKHLPEQAAWYDRIAPGYARMLHALVTRFIGAGWQVVSVPLAPEDDLFARSLLRHLPVEHLAYTSDPLRILREFATAERALVTRFHAHVFSILSQTPFGSFAYSPKCSDLFSELKLVARAQAQPGDWVHDFEATRERLSADDATATVSEAGVGELEARAYDLTRRGVLAVLDRS